MYTIVGDNELADNIVKRLSNLVLHDNSSELQYKDPIDLFLEKIEVGEGEYREYARFHLTHRIDYLKEPLYKTDYKGDTKERLAEIKQYRQRLKEFDGSDWYEIFDECRYVISKGDSEVHIHKSHKEFKDMWKAINEGIVESKINNLLSISYKDYLQTEHRLSLREEAKRRDGYRCRMCGSYDELEVHHRSYKNRGNYEKELEDLTTLCNKCHSLHHGK